jgi:hypothetical protein
MGFLWDPRGVAVAQRRPRILMKQYGNSTFVIHFQLFFSLPSKILDSAAAPSHFPFRISMQGVIEFEGDQRDAVYKILNDAAAARIEKENGNPDSSALSLNGMGIDLDPYDLGLQDAMKEAALKTRTSGDETDRKQMTKNFRTLIDQRIETKVDQMRPVLNDKQLDQYRAELKSKGSGILGGAMMDLGNGGSGVSSIVIPAN